MKMNIRTFWALGALLALTAFAARPAHAAIRVIAATDNLAWVTQQIGGKPVSDPVCHGANCAAAGAPARRASGGRRLQRAVAPASHRLRAALA